MKVKKKNIETKKDVMDLLSGFMYQKIYKCNYCSCKFMAYNVFLTC